MDSTLQFPVRVITLLLASFLAIPVFLYFRSLEQLVEWPVFPQKTRPQLGSSLLPLLQNADV